MSGFEVDAARAIPEGRSFEVAAPDAATAIVNARTIALEGMGLRLDRVLHVEQIEAGKFEVVLEDLVVGLRSRFPWGARTQEVARNAEAAALLTRFLVWLRENTDTFDPVAVQIAIDGGTFVPDAEMIQNWIAQYLESGA